MRDPRVPVCAADTSRVAVGGPVANAIGSPCCWERCGFRKRTEQETKGSVWVMYPFHLELAYGFLGLCDAQALLQLHTHSFNLYLHITALA